ncbi:hypothetical protein ACTFIZ_010375 [Dictyostelium cf. discoideum]
MSNQVELEEIDYFHHCTTEKNGDNIIKYGLVPYRADDTFYDGKLCTEDSPKIVFFACFKYNGGDITRTPYPRTKGVDEKVVMLKFSLKKLKYNEYKLFELDEQEIHNVRHKKFFMVHEGHEKGLKFANENNFNALEINNNNYLRYNIKSKKWETCKYDKEKLIIDIVFCSYNLPKPKTDPSTMDYMGGKIENAKRKSVFYSISEPSPITKIDYGIVDDKNNVQFTYKFTIVSHGIGLNCGIQRIDASPTNHSLPFKKNLLNTIISCSNTKIEDFSMNSNDYKTIKSLSEHGEIAIIDKNSISILTNLEELVIISIIHTEMSPLSPQKNRKLAITDRNDQEDLSNKFIQTLKINTN